MNLFRGPNSSMLSNSGRWPFPGVSVLSWYLSYCTVPSVACNSTNPAKAWAFGITEAHKPWSLRHIIG